MNGLKVDIGVAGQWISYGYTHDTEAWQAIMNSTSVCQTTGRYQVLAVNSALGYPRLKELINDTAFVGIWSLARVYQVDNSF